MNVIKLIRGLEIIAQYSDAPVTAEHNEIYAGCDRSSRHRMRSADRDDLDYFGWIWDDDVNRWSFSVWWEWDYKSEIWRMAS